MRRGSKKYAPEPTYTEEEYEEYKAYGRFASDEEARLRSTPAHKPGLRRGPVALSDELASQAPLLLWGDGRRVGGLLGSASTPLMPLDGTDAANAHQIDTAVKFWAAALRGRAVDAAGAGAWVAVQLELGVAFAVRSTLPRSGSERRARDEENALGHFQRAMSEVSPGDDAEWARAVRAVSLIFGARAARAESAGDLDGAASAAELSFENAEQAYTAFKTARQAAPLVPRHTAAASRGGAASAGSSSTATADAIAGTRDSAAGKNDGDDGEREAAELSLELAISYLRRRDGGHARRGARRAAARANIECAIDSIEVRRTHIHGATEIYRSRPPVEWS